MDRAKACDRSRVHCSCVVVSTDDWVILKVDAITLICYSHTLICYDACTSFIQFLALTLGCNYYHLSLSFAFLSSLAIITPIYGPMSLIQAHT